MLSAGPIPPSERIDTIDILRGIALLIVLIINTATEFRVSIFEQFLPGPKATGLADQISEAVILATHTKGFILFAFLFGAGLAIQFDRLAGDRHRLTLMVRRLSILMAIGSAHLLASAAAISLGIHVASPLLPQIISFPDSAWMTDHVSRARQAYGAGSFMEILAFRVDEVRYIAPLHVYALPRTFGLFLLGASAWRTDLFRPTGSRKHLSVAACIALTIGAWLTVAAARGEALGWPLNWQGRNIFQSLAQLVLAAGYGATIIVLAEHVVGRKFVGLAGPLGRTAFTNYIVQSIILSWVFYGFGLALFGRLSVPQSLAVALAIYATQAAFSAGWLRRFRFGPIEWLWRSLMYGQLQRATKEVR
jgi:uncharacterized protein